MIIKYKYYNYDTGEWIIQSYDPRLANYVPKVGDRIITTPAWTNVARWPWTKNVPQGTLGTNEL